MINRNKNFNGLILLLLVILLFTGLTVKADTGPKPYVHITIEGIDSVTYVSLLSKQKSTGPYQALTEENHQFEELSAIELKFYEYAKTSDYYFLGNVQKLDKDNNIFKWTYYPPYVFLVVCYIEDSDIFVITNEELSRYAFSTYYKIYLEKINNTYVLNNIKRNYNYGSEILHLLLRIVLTLAIELSLAFFIFKFKGKSFIIIIIINLITQIGLNISLNVINFNYGPNVLFFDYILLEMLIIIIEMITYLIVLKSIKKEYKAGIIILYALSANVLSFVLGLVLTYYIPGLI